MRTSRRMTISRRELLGSIGAGAILASRRSSVSQDDARGALAAVVSSSTTSLAGAVVRKQISSEDVVRLFLGRIEEVNPRLNAVVQLTAETALERAREADRALSRGEREGPLHGVPMTIADSFDTAGVVSTAGTLGSRDTIPRDDAIVVSRLEATGAILLGRPSSRHADLPSTSEATPVGAFAFPATSVGSPESSRRRDACRGPVTSSASTISSSS